MLDLQVNIYDLALGLLDHSLWLDDDEVTHELTNAAANADHAELEEGTEQAIGHLAGYLVSSCIHHTNVNPGLASLLIRKCS